MGAMMQRVRWFRIAVGLAAMLPLAIIGIALKPNRILAQEPYQFETDLVSRHRVFRGVGPGFRAMRRAPNGNYFILTAPDTAVRIYDITGKPLGQVPSETAAKMKNAALVFGDSFDVDNNGRLAVCDRGANAIKIYSADGALLNVIPFSAPVSVAWLLQDEVAITGPSASHLVSVYGVDGNLLRDFGDREEIADRADLNNQVNFGEIQSDKVGNTYFAFDYLPEPTVRLFDHAGYLSSEISLTTLEFQPAAQAARRAIARSETGIPALHRIINAMGIDPQSHEVWLAIGTQLMHFDKEGNRLATYRTYMPSNARLEAGTILVEPDRLLIGADPQGIYEFRKPVQTSQ
jgi:hypothetical protein